MSFDLGEKFKSPVIKVIGIGGAGCIAIEHMQLSKLHGVKFVAINTDANSLKAINVETKIQIGKNLTNGLGTASSPLIGRQAALEDRVVIKEILSGSDMIFISAGLGGGTGTGVAPVVAQMAKEMGILTLAMITTPFPFEKKRIDIAQKGIEDLSKYADSVLTIPNEKLSSVLGKSVSVYDGFKAANDVLLHLVRGITELITDPGMINIDLSDVRAVLSGTGVMVIGSGRATGENRAREATEAAISSPLLEDFNLNNAKGVLVNVKAGLDLSIGELDDVGSTITQFLSDNTTVIIGTVIDSEMADEICVSLIASDLGDQSSPKEDHAEANASDDVFDDLDIPAFLKRQTDEHERTKSNNDVVNTYSRLRSLKFVADETVSDDEIAELIVHLSNVYRSIGGDELVIQAVGLTPPPTKKSNETLYDSLGRRSVK